jgi:hypothetical protein
MSVRYAEGFMGKQAMRVDHVVQMLERLSKKKVLGKRTEFRSS